MTSVLSKIFGNPGSTEFWSTLRSNGLGPAAEERKISSDKFDDMIMLIKTRVERLAVGSQSLEDEPFTRDSSILCERKIAAVDEDDLALLREKHPRDSSSPNSKWPMSVE